MLKNLIKQNSLLKTLYLFGKRVTEPVVASPVRSAIAEYPRFFKDLKKFRQSGGVARSIDLYPCLFDRMSVTRIDAHYFHQAIWAFRKIVESQTQFHIDIASQAVFVGMLSTLVPTVFIDIRPLKLTMNNYLGVDASILCLPFADNSVRSLSCLHVIEHIGLGRYGDPIEPKGAEQAAHEIVRVMAPGSSVYLSTPIGRARVQFNGQRIFSPDQIINMFKPLELKEISVVNARGVFIEESVTDQIDIQELGSGNDFGLGMFWFVKPGDEKAN